MANTNRVRYGDQEHVTIPVDDTTVVEIGDVICRVVSADNSDDNTLTVGYGCPPTYLVDAGDAAANREAAADQFVGLSLVQSLDGQENDLLIQTAGMVALDQKAAAAIDFGDPIEMYADATSCEDQTVVEGSTSPIAVCVKKKSSSGTEILAKLLPSKLLGMRQELSGD